MMMHQLFSRVSRHTFSQLKTLGGTHRLLSQLAEIRDQLGQHQAGTVELQKNTDTGIAVLTLDNPGRKNALSGSMMVELADRVTELSQWQEGKGLILRGAQDTFCSGGDLTMVSAILTSEDGARMARFMHDTLSRLHNLPLVSLALLQGVALGGGAELATACDIRVMTDSAKLGFVQIRMGITTGWGGAIRLVKLLGRPTTLHVLGSGKVISANEALTLGLVEHSIPDGPDDPLSAAEVLLQDGYCRGGAELVRGIKEMVVGIENSASVADALEFERRTFASVWGGDMQKEALEKHIKHS